MWCYVVDHVFHHVVLCRPLRSKTGL
jgi:hypothetical protein